MQKRKARDLNIQYTILRTAVNSLFSSDAPDKVIELGNKDKKADEKDRKKFVEIGVAGDNDLHNPNLKVFDSTKPEG